MTGQRQWQVGRIIEQMVYLISHYRQIVFPTDPHQLLPTVGGQDTAAGVVESRDRINKCRFCFFSCFSRAGMIKPFSSIGTPTTLSRWSAKIRSARKYEGSSTSTVSPGWVNSVQIRSSPWNAPAVINKRPASTKTP